METILLTGSTGFLGKEILKIFSQKHVITLARSNANIIADIKNNIPELPAVNIVVHAAAKAHSIPGKRSERKEFFDINMLGTKNLCAALENGGIPKAFIFISTVAVYGVDVGKDIAEDHSLSGKTPYALSKIQAECFLKEWCIKHNIVYTILRLPLIVGANPPGNLKIMINGIKNGWYFNIAGGKAKKSMVLAEDIAKIIPIAATIGGIYNLTDGYHPNFSELSQLMAKQLRKSTPLNIPMWMAKLMAKAGDFIGTQAPINSDKLIKITSDLTFDDSKARELLSWKPTPVLTGFRIK